MQFKPEFPDILSQNHNISYHLLNMPGNTNLLKGGTLSAFFVTKPSYVKSYEIYFIAQYVDQYNGPYSVLQVKILFYSYKICMQAIECLCYNIYATWIGVH